MRRHALLTRLALAGALAAAAVWIGAAALAAGHGFDPSDEGFYLLSYRWWNAGLYSFTGVQYLYGPVFGLLGHDVERLRLFRLVTVVGTHLVFGWSLMGWLRPRRPRAPLTIAWERAGTLTVTAAGGMLYSWLPLSPGYNDVSVLGALLAAALVLRMASDVEIGSKVPAWAPFGLGFDAVAMLLSKWTSAVAVLCVCIAAGTAVVWQRDRAGLSRLGAWTLVGLLAGAAAVNWLLVPLKVVVPDIAALSTGSAAATHAVGPLLGAYARDTLAVLARAAVTHALLIVAPPVVALIWRRQRWRAAGWVLVGVAVLVSAGRIVQDGGLRGGVPSLPHVEVGLVAVVLAAASAAALGRRRRPNDRAGLVIGGMLALLPLAQAVGTNNPLPFIAVLGYGSLAGIVLIVATGAEGLPPPVRALTAVLAAASAAMPATIATNALWHHPYRTVPPTQATQRVDVPALSSIALGPAEAAGYAELYRQLRPWVEPPGRFMIAFDEIAGVVFALDGRPMGEAWQSVGDPARTAAGLAASCPGQRGPWGARPPVVIFNRERTAADDAALAGCSLRLDRDYRPPLAAPLGLTVYLPRAG